MNGLPNFPLLFKQIGNYLAKAPNASQQELDAAIEAYHTIYITIYHPPQPLRCTIFPIDKNLA